MAPKVAKSVAEWQFLPFDIVIEILSRLPVKSLLKFRSVCRQWSSLTYDPHFINKHLHRVPSCLSFIPRRIERNDIKLYDYFKDGTFAMHSSYKISIKQQVLYVMSNFVNGLTCAYVELSVDGDLFLLNPFIREYAQLLSIRNNCNRSDSFGFGYDVSTGKYKLVRLFFPPDLPKTTQYCEIQTIGTQEWRYLGEIPCQVTRAYPVYVDGAIYWKGLGLTLLRFDVKLEKFAITSGPPHTLVPSPDIAWYEYSSCLYGSAGHLYLIQKGFTSLYFKIWLMNDFATGLWTNLCDIDASSLTELPGFVMIFGIENDKILLVLSEFRNCRRRRTFLCYDTRSKTFLKLHDKEAPFGWLAPCSQSLISPRKLIENVASL